MVQLILVYCLSSAPLSCVEKRTIPEVPVSAMECMIEAQPIAAEFLRGHPGYALNSFRCEIDHPEEKHI